MIGYTFLLRMEILYMNSQFTKLKTLKKFNQLISKIILGGQGLHKT